MDERWPPGTRPSSLHALARPYRRPGFRYGPVGLNQLPAQACCPACLRGCRKPPPLGAPLYPAQGKVIERDRERERVEVADGFGRDDERPPSGRYSMPSTHKLNTNRAIARLRTNLPLAATDSADPSGPRNRFCSSPKTSSGCATDDTKE